MENAIKHTLHCQDDLGMEIILGSYLCVISIFLEAVLLKLNAPITILSNSFNPSISSKCTFPKQ